MARPPSRDRRVAAPPPPRQVPPEYPEVIGAAHLVESMMQIQQAIGELKSDVRHLTAASDKQSKKLDRISHIIFAAGVVMTIILAIGGFALNKMWDGMVTMVTQQQAKQPTPPAKSP
jgi:hypothetical protein